MNKSSKNSKIELSIIIVNYNTGKLLQECINSVVRTTQDLKNPSCEIIIIDNASTDGSQKIKGPIVLIENKNNPGFSVANNQGLKIAKGEYVLLLNPDTKVKSEAIQNLLSFARQREDIGVVGAKLILGNGQIQKSVFREPSIINAFKEFWLNKESYSSYSPGGDNPVEVSAVVGAAFLITPQALKKVGYLNEKYFMYFEDTDYCRKVREAGLKVYYLPSSQIIHYHGVSGKGLIDSENQWRRLIPSSKLYHGILKHYVLNFVIWFGSRILHRK